MDLVDFFKILYVVFQVLCFLFCFIWNFTEDVKQLPMFKLIYILCKQIMFDRAKCSSDYSALYLQQKGIVFWKVFLPKKKRKSTQHFRLFHLSILNATDAVSMTELMKAFQ